MCTCTGRSNSLRSADTRVVAAGAQVAKHGNKAASSKSGSTEVLEALGVKIDIGPDLIARCIAEAQRGCAIAPPWWRPTSPGCWRSTS